LKQQVHLVAKSAARLLLIIILLVPVGACVAQQCRDSLAVDATDQRFDLSADGSVIDQHTHLAWMRCSVGQQWDKENNTCNSEPQSLTWFQAREFVENRINRGSNWRLPSIQELSSLTELGCYHPAIDLRWFPNTPASHYWSATPFANKEGHYWLVQFLSGENHTDSGRRLAFVRLVKTLLPSPFTP
jgi:hypothetical protein